MPRITGSPTQITTEGPTPGALALLLCAGLHQGDEAWVDSLNKAFMLDRTSLATPNGTSVIATSDGVGNWVVSPGYANQPLFLVTNAIATPTSVTIPNTSQPGTVVTSLALPSASFLPQPGDICISSFTFAFSAFNATLFNIYTLYTDPAGAVSYGGPSAPTKGTQYSLLPEVYSAPWTPNPSPGYETITQTLVITSTLAAAIANAVKTASATYAGFGVQLTCDLPGPLSGNPVLVLYAASLIYYRP